MEHPEMRIIIAGGRDFTDYPLLREKCDRILSHASQSQKIIVVSGTARGADSLGERYAREREYRIEQYPADWKTHGKSAGYIRNCQMAKVGNALIAFWDGQSRGTKNMIEIAQQNGLQVHVIHYSPRVNSLSNCLYPSDKEQTTTFHFKR